MTYRCPTGLPSCVFWNESLRGWDRAGCSLTAVGQANITCRCNRKQQQQRQSAAYAPTPHGWIYGYMDGLAACLAPACLPDLFRCGGGGGGSKDLTDFSVQSDVSSLLFASASYYPEVLPPRIRWAGHDDEAAAWAAG